MTTRVSKRATKIISSTDITPHNTVCYRCGKNYTGHKAIFPVSHNPMYKGVGTLHICRSCVDDMFLGFLAHCNRTDYAARQVCRKLDIYWNERAFESVSARTTSRTVMTKYLQRINSANYLGKCYDDTLIEESKLWDFIEQKQEPVEVSPVEQKQELPEENTEEDEESVFEEPIILGDDIEVTQEIIDFWGSGYTPTMYKQLEQRLRYYVSKPQFKDADLSDIGTEQILKNICILEVDIAKDRMEGKPVDKYINTLNTLLGSAKWKPNQKEEQKDDDEDFTPFGVWVRRFENEKPIPEPDPSFADTDGIAKYILTWVYGHLSKMLGVRNANTALYEKEIEKLRVKHPEFDDDDDDALLAGVFGDKEDDEE